MSGAFLTPWDTLMNETAKALASHRPDILDRILIV